MRQPSALYTRHRFPGEVISHAAWLYFRSLLSYRDVEEVLAERGIAVSYETIRCWCRTFGATYADGVRFVAPDRGTHPEFKGSSQRSRFGVNIRARSGLLRGSASRGSCVADR